MSAANSAPIEPTTAAPGTVVLYDLSDSGDDQPGDYSHLQHAKHGDSHILLVPQPSLTDPNDPLIWPNVLKWITLCNALCYAFLGAVTGPIMAAGMIQLTKKFGKSLQELTYANGATLICQGVATTLWMPFAVKYGRRPVYLLSTFLMGVVCVWLGIAATKTYTPFLVGRAFLGIFEAPIESIVPSTVTDIFFLHDRGEKLSLYGLSVLGGNELGPMFSAFIIQALGMNWAFYIVAMFVFANFISMIICMPETKYLGTRPAIVPRSFMGKETHLSEKCIHIEDLPAEAGSPYKDTFVQRMAFWKMCDPDETLLRAFYRPFILIIYPTVLWSCLVYGMALSWNVILGASVAQLFAPPPYLFSSNAQGLVFLSPLTGSLIGTYICGPLADRIATYYTKRNGGIREPEMRLPTCVIAAFLTFFGALMTGLCLNYQTHWAGPVVGYGVLSAGAQMAATLSMSYSLDSHKELSIELMVTIASLKSLVAWIWTWVINDWLARDGPLIVFCTVAAINTAVFASTLGIYWQGKNIRVWLQRKAFLGPVAQAY